jgi:asparagine synthase (glutamine-hydrolysing)
MAPGCGKGAGRPEAVVERMLARIQHRGRELPSVGRCGDATLGCCRLSIVDREGGRQPVWNEDRTVAAVFNGEIYNEAELRAGLSGTHRLATNCDSELIPHLYERGGIDGLRRDLRGMYAIGLFDSRDGTAYLLRDLVGKKPLFFAESAEGLLFASEAKAFERGLPASELAPGEVVAASGGRIERRTAAPPWREDAAGGHADMDEAADRLFECLDAAVARRIPRDLPVAVLCSGGIDSVAIAYLAHRLAPDRVTAYVIGGNDAPDVLASTAACRYLGIPLERVIITEAYLTSIVADVVYHTESFEPNVVRNGLIAYRLFEHIRARDYRVALCGEGADELFYGYADYEDAADGCDLMGRLMDDLYRTQLLRVDRTSMAFNIEVRAPFLDLEVIRLACGMDPRLKQCRVYGLWQGKAVLRRAFRGVLPWETITRSKATLSYGAGFGDVSMDDWGPIERYARRFLQRDKPELEAKYPHIALNTYERALYLHFFERFFDVPSEYTTPTVATHETRLDRRAVAP